MHITVLSVTEHGDKVSARARAEAENATIHLQVQFDREATEQRDLWSAAKDEVLRYLDVA